MNKNRAAFAALFAILAAFLFVSCDAILETVYPEYKAGKDAGSDTGMVVVEVAYDSTLANYNNRGFANGDYPIAVGLVPFQQMASGYKPEDGAIQVQMAKYAEFEYNAEKGKNIKKFVFPVRSNATSKVVAWLDVNKNQRPKILDGQGTIDEPGSIVLSQAGDFFLDLRYFNPSDSSIHMGITLNATNTINTTQFNADPLAQGQSGGASPNKPTIVVPYMNIASGTQITMESSGEFDPDGYIVDRKWTIQFPNQADKVFNGMTVLPFTFNNPGTTDIKATIKLEVKDNSGNLSLPASIVLTILKQGSTVDNKAPIARIDQGAVMTVSNGQSVFLTSSSSSDPDGTIVAYEWRLGSASGNILGTAPDFFYTPPENTTAMDKVYLVYLRVKDNKEKWSDTPPNTAPSITVTVKASGQTYDSPPYVDFSASPGFEVAQGTMVSFTDESWDLEGPIIERRWKITAPNFAVQNFGNLTYLSSITMSQIGTYKVQLEVREAGINTPWSVPQVKEVFVTDPNQASDLGSWWNPIPLASGSQRSGYVESGTGIYYVITLQGKATQNVKLDVISTDLDLYVYPDATYSDYSVGSSEQYGAATDETVNVGGLTTVYVEVWNPTGMGGSFNILGEVLN